MKISRNRSQFIEFLSDSSTPFYLSSIRAVSASYLEKYYKEYYEENSFFICEDNEVFACVMVASKEDDFSYLGMPVRVEIASKNLSECGRERLYSLLAKEIKELVSSSHKVVLEVALDGGDTIPFIETLLPHASSHGLFAESHADLTGDWSRATGPRKSHKQSIKKASGLLEPPKLWFGELDFGEFESFRHLHHESAGRITRSSASWDEMSKAIIDKRASLVTVSESDQVIGATFSWVSASTGWYASGAYDRSRFNDFPIAHWTLIHAVDQVKELGRSRYVFGEAFSPGRSAKEKGISQFKRGFSKTRKYFHRLVLN